MAASKTPKTPNFEKSLEALEDIITDMESGDLSLEESLKAFEKGIKLTRDCQTSLKQAEQRVQILLQDANGESLEDFQADQD